jgi:hypothetical protein
MRMGEYILSDRFVGVNRMISGDKSCSHCRHYRAYELKCSHPNKDGVGFDYNSCWAACDDKEHEMEVKKENWIYLNWPSPKGTKITDLTAEICNQKLDNFNCWIGDKQISIKSFDDLKLLANALSDLVEFIEKDKLEKTKDSKNEKEETMERKLRPEGVRFETDTFTDLSK